MRRRICVLAFGLLLLPTLGLLAADEAPSKSESVAAIVESSLRTDGGHIRQFCFDGNADTYFASEQNPAASDHFTLTFDKPVAVKSIVVATGTPDGKDKLATGELEVSTDGKKFESIAKFAADGTASAKPDDRRIAAVRIHPADHTEHPLVIREITIDSTPRVATFKYPIEFVIDVSDAPEMKEWTEKCARTCEREYPMINEQLPSDGFRPARVVHMKITPKYGGVAYTAGTNIVGAVKWFKDHPEDVGAMVHETVHVVQSYRGRGNPGWLVEGIADYVRFFKYEPPKALGRINADRSHYNGSYRVTAAFLNYLVKTYDKEIVRKLNAAMRAGKYNEDLFKDSTGKSLEDLDDAWRATLKK